VVRAFVAVAAACAGEDISAHVQKSEGMWWRQAGKGGAE